MNVVIKKKDDGDSGGDVKNLGLYLQYRRHVACC
jgi:hypothetical protein